MRVVRSATLPVREELYIAAAQRVRACRGPTSSRRHVLPRIAGAVIVQASLLAALALLVQTGLAFLNLVVAAPAPELGRDGRRRLRGDRAPAVADLAARHRDRRDDPRARPARRRGPRRDDRGLVGAATSRRRQRARLGGRSARCGHADEAAGDAGGAARRSGGLRRRARRPRRRRAITSSRRAASTIERRRDASDSSASPAAERRSPAMSILGLLPAGGEIAAGQDPRSTAATSRRCSERELRRIRGQGDRAHLAGADGQPRPVFRVGSQLAEAVRRHHGVSRREPRTRKRSSCSGRSACRTRSSSRGATRTSCRAGWRSVSRSRGRSPASRGC